MDRLGPWGRGRNTSLEDGKGGGAGWGMGPLGLEGRASWWPLLGQRREPRKRAAGGRGVHSVHPHKERRLPFLLRKEDGRHFVWPCLPLDALIHPVGSRSPLQRQAQTRRDVSDLGGCRWGGGTEGLGVLGHILPSRQPHRSLGHLWVTWGAGRAEGLWRDGGLRSRQSSPSPG